MHAAPADTDPCLVSSKKFSALKRALRLSRSRRRLLRPPRSRLHLSMSNRLLQCSRLPLFHLPLLRLPLFRLPLFRLP